MSQCSDNNKNMCFVCLEKCKINFCDVCTAYAHSKCLNQYIDTQNTIEVQCPVCKTELQYGKTRREAEKKRWKSLARYFKKMCLIIEEEKKISQKKYLAKRLFGMVIKNRYFIKKRNAYLIPTIKSKLVELHREGWKPAQEYLYKLEK